MNRRSFRRRFCGGVWREEWGALAAGGGGGGVTTLQGKLSTHERSVCNVNEKLEEGFHP